MFKGDKFNADEWAELFYLKIFGAKFVVDQLPEHHDGYAMWDSSISPWNAKDTGPCGDIVGELASSIRKELKFITTFHHARMGRATLAFSSERDKRKWHYYGREKYFERTLPVIKILMNYQNYMGLCPQDSFLKMWNKN